MGLIKGTVVALHPVCGMAVLKKANEDDEEWAISKVDDLGRIALSDEIRQRLGWETRTKIAIYCVDDETVFLKLA
ncbi:MAG: AbrB/MazE/SpoVT family DNA-binding domain-containing protein [Defluviitaleaceae bacterium]|nr:AbrB/MazE/SpoVT family DNA-binding domain-containing protein [Defluviitaleaceae bacterium]